MMRLALTWLSAALAIAAIAFAVWGVAAERDENAAVSPWSIGMFAAVGIGCVLLMQAWALTRGRDVVAPVVFRFSALQLVIGVVFAVAVLAVARGGTHTVGPWLTIVIAMLVFCLGWISAGIGRNRLIGFRTPRTLADDRTWREANRMFGRALMMLSPLSLVGVVAGNMGPLIAMAPTVIVAVVFLWRDARTRS